MRRNLLSILFFCFCIFSGLSQEIKETEQQKDSIRKNLKKKGVVVDELLLSKKKKINPLAPSKAAFYSAIFPGLGQIYNKKYWKVPLVYGAVGTGVYAYTYNNRQYNRFRTAFKRRQAGFTDDEFYDINDDNPEGADPDFDQSDLQGGQERFQRDRDLSLLVTIALYALNVIDANVDAHLKQFNVDDDLSMDIKPYLNYNTITADPNYGLALTIKF